jgi:hypothetical protein
MGPLSQVSGFTFVVNPSQINARRVAAVTDLEMGVAKFLDQFLPQ